MSNYNSFSFIKNIQLSCPKQGELIHPELNKFSLRLFASDVTHHAVLEIERTEVDENLILEDVPGFVSNFKEKVNTIGSWVKEKFKLEAKVWGDMGFSLLIFMDPDLHFHKPEKLQRPLLHQVLILKKV